VDYAGNSPNVLNEVKRRGTVLLDHAGFDSVWKTCSPTRGERSNLKVCSSDPMTVWIRILPPQMARRLPLDQRSCGVAAQDDLGPFSNTAFVYAACVQRIARRNASAWPTILAHIIVHEIGHLLLGAGNHAPAGLMRAEWRKSELHLMLTGGLNFTAQEAELMRSALARRKTASMYIHDTGQENDHRSDGYSAAPESGRKIPEI
jgi:hypothetical protein